MEFFNEFIENLPTEQKNKLTEIINWMETNYPDFEPMIKWKQPMFAYKGTFIISYAPYKAHIAVAPEVKTMELFREKIEAVGYETTNNTFKIKYDHPTHFELLKELIEFQKTDKAGWTKFWR